MRILFVWHYERPDLTDPLVQALKGADLHFLYKYEREDGEQSFSHPVHYWNDFKSPYEILRKIKPDKIVFMEIETFHHVALNIAARNAGVVTYRLEHGIKAPYKSYASYPALHPSASRKRATAQKGNSINTLLFYLRSFRLRNAASVFMLLKFIYTRSKLGTSEGLSRCRFRLRRPVWYIDFTPFNSRFTLERDRPDPGDYIYIGNPNFDKYFKYVKEKQPTAPAENYYLLIDSGFVEDPAFRIDAAIIIDFYRKLNLYCRQKGAKLKIKLHPLSYHAAYLPEDENIIYLRDANVIEEILGSKGCFHSHFSTLTPLAMYYSPSILFDASPAFNVDIKQLGLMTVLDFYTFQPQDMMLRSLNDEEKQLIVERYFYSTEGNACEQLAKVLFS
jgi:hypothetical protein